ncbi:MAG TPA: flagellar hook capping FlgD N-terminal domain-containing protein [Proteiniclasticum sp.]|nr:flagellar hook capping FlgD N-terminal domain-containing protein [Proteiniclasticum sp.]
MKINGIGMPNEVLSTQSAVKTNDAMGVDDFLKIMTAQLQNLDPMGGNSADTGEYISQMAQFTMLEQLSTLSASLESMTTLSQQQLSFSLVGKNVSVFNGESSIEGVVEKIRFREGQAYPVINDVEYPMYMVQEVGGE